MDSKSKHKLIKDFLKKSKKTSCNLLVSTVATTSILGAMSVSGNTLTNAGLQTVQASTENAKDGKNAKLTKKSYIYNNRGKRTSKKALKKSKSVKVYGTKVIKGKIYYNLGHECYVLAKDVKIAKTVKVTKNAYVYNSQGKRISKKALKKGQNLEVYGTKTIKGKKYYALGNGGYVPVNNVKVPKATETPSPTVGDNSNGTTPNKPDNSGST
ncbi:SLAP domain-containing protein, partial [Lactobacillus bombicola]